MPRVLLSGIKGAHSSYRAMKDRCLRPGNIAYHRYGGRGISITPEWLGEGGWERFLAYMGPRPPRTTIDRINGNGNYEPGNVRWANDSVQGENLTPETRAKRSANAKRISRRWKHAGAIRSLKAYGRVLGLNATDALMADIHGALVDQFGPLRNAPEPAGMLSIEWSFSEADFRFASYHFEGLEYLSAKSGVPVSQGTFRQVGANWKTSWRAACRLSNLGARA